MLAAPGLLPGFGLVNALLAGDSARSDGGPGPFFALLGLGTALLGVAKILENMEIGHNVGAEGLRGLALTHRTRDPGSGAASNRYVQVAPRVRELAVRFGLPYNTGSLLRQYGTTTLTIWRMWLPLGGKSSPKAASHARA